MQSADAGGHSFLSLRGASLLDGATGDVLSSAAPGSISLRSLDSTLLYETVAPVLDSIEFRPQALFTYGPTAGSPLLRQIIAARASAAPAHVVVTDGASQALTLVLASIVNPNDRVLIPSPGFPAYGHIVRLFQGTPEPYEWSSSNAEIVAGLEAKLGTSPRALILNSPHNPTGGLLPSADVARLTEIARSRGVYVVLDDAYAWMVNDPDRLTFYGEVVPRAPDGLAVVCSLSKYLCLPGLRLGCIVTSDRPVLEAAIELKRHLSQCSCPMQEQLATDLMSHPRLSSAKSALLSTLNKRRVRLTQILTALRSGPYEGGAGFYLFVRDGTEAEEHGLVGIPGVIFGAAPSARRYSLAVSPAEWDNLEYRYAV